MRNNALNITQLNHTLTDEAHIPVISFDDFKKIHTGQGTKLEKMVAKIDYVNRLKDGYEFAINKDDGSKKIIRVLYDGSVSTNGSKYQKLLDTNNGHLRIVHNNNSVFVEKMILICEAILHNELPISFKGICVNVMNGTGNVWTADYLGLKSYYGLDNLEWTLNYKNWTHGKYIKKLYAIMKKAYKYSANDQVLFELIATKDDNIIKNYVDSHYTV